MRLVIDTNIVISAIVQDQFAPQASRLIYPVPGPTLQLAAPQILVTETAHVLLKLHRMRRVSVETARKGFLAARRLPFVLLQDRPLTPDDFDLGLRYTIAGSDLLFVRLARELECPLVTMDKALRTNTAGVVETLDLEGALQRLGV